MNKVTDLKSSKQDCEAETKIPPNDDMNPSNHEMVVITKIILIIMIKIALPINNNIMHDHEQNDNNNVNARFMGIFYFCSCV